MFILKFYLGFSSFFHVAMTAFLINCLCLRDQILRLETYPQQVCSIRIYES